MYEYELYHHGVKGMKWGVRKKDRKLSRIQKKAGKRGWSEDARTASEIGTKNPKQMSNAELKKLNERTRLEREYKQLNPSTVSKGMSYVVKTAAVMGTAITLYNNSNQLIGIGKKVGERIIGDTIGKAVFRSTMNAMHR